MSASRTFTASKAIRKAAPLLIGLVGPSGGGKTMSALRLATGMARVSGGRVKVIDTEADRALNYADRFDFDHIPFAAPFSPRDYLEAIKYAASLGPGPIVIDSMSHEHEGPGGVLEMHDAELQRLGGGDKNSFRAWAAPKFERQRLINSILQMRAHFIFCFRAKRKTKPEKGSKDLIQLGWMAIAGDNFIFEMTAKLLLLPGADGVPTPKPEHEAEREMVKLPEFFRPLFTGEARQLDEAMGEAMARWAAGDNAPGPASTPKPPMTLSALAKELVARGLSSQGERLEWIQQTMARDVRDPTKELTGEDLVYLAGKLPQLR